MKSGAGDDPFAEPAVQSDRGDEGDDETDADTDEETTSGGPDATDEADPEPTGDESEPRTNGAVTDSDEDAEVEDSDDSDDGDAAEASEAGESDAPAQEIPYKFRRSSVKEGRTQRPIFVREAVEDRESEFIRTLEDEVGEKVYKTDAMEAALIVAMDNPDLVADQLREWGYDWE